MAGRCSGCNHNTTITITESMRNNLHELDDSHESADAHDDGDADAHIKGRLVVHHLWG